MDNMMYNLLNSPHPPSTLFINCTFNNSTQMGHHGELTKEVSGAENHADEVAEMYEHHNEQDNWSPSHDGLSQRTLEAEIIPADLTQSHYIYKPNFQQPDVPIKTETTDKTSNNPQQETHDRPPSNQISHSQENDCHCLSSLAPCTNYRQPFVETASNSSVQANGGSIPSETGAVVDFGCRADGLTQLRSPNHSRAPKPRRNRWGRAQRTEYISREPSNW